MRYIGSKVRVVEAILDIVGDPVTGSTFVDGFCGTGVVAEEAARRGWPIRVNDMLQSATTMAAARMTSRRAVPFAQFGSYEQAVELLNAADPIEGFLWREYSPASGRHGEHERRYFTEPNAAKLDAMRRQVGVWATTGALLPAEERLLLADLLAAVSAVANIAGTYGCFLRDFSGSSLQPVQLRARTLFGKDVEVDVHNTDVKELPTSAVDVAYFDPPYTKRQYAAYYHILETITVGDEPEVGGVTGLRPWQNKASDYCYKTRALGALVDLLDTVAAQRVVLSYSSEGHVPQEELEEHLHDLGDVAVHALGPIGRYRPNRAASAAGSSVSEYVIELNKADTGALGAVA